MIARSVDRDTRRPWGAFIRILTMLGLLLGGGSAVAVDAASLSGESHTILRLQETADDRGLHPLYEYLNAGGETEWGGGALSAGAGGWGRVDLRSRAAGDPNDRALQYVNVGYSGSRGNLSIQAGRQFIAEGVAAERLDGLYLRSDLAAGFAAAAFIGSPVVTQPDFPGGDLLYGGRIAHSMPRVYSLGISVLRTDESGKRLREEAGVDLWIHPYAELDLVGRSSYNSLTSGWMEHAYRLRVTPLEPLRINAEWSAASYRDYFHNVTTKAFRLATGLLDPREKISSLGASVDYVAGDRFTLSADYKNHQYEIAGRAHRYGAKASLVLPGSFIAGLSVHRMNGDSARLRFDEYRLFLSQAVGSAQATAELFSVNYDGAVNGVKGTYSAVLAASYAVSRQWTVAADIEYGRSVDFNGRLSGLVRLTYLFDLRLDGEAGGRHGQ